MPLETRPVTVTVDPKAEPARSLNAPEQPTENYQTVKGETHAVAAKTGAERIAATVAAKAGTVAGTAAATAPALAVSGTAAAPAAVAGGVVDDAAIAAASAKAAELAETKAAIVTEPESFEQRAAKAAELFKTDPLKAMELLGMPLDKALKQATGGDITAPTEAEQLRAELEQERALRAADQAKAVAAQAAAQAEAQKQATVAAIIADPAYPNVNDLVKVEAAFADARAAYKILVADLGRPLNQTEADKLVAYHLKKHNDKAQTGTGTVQNPLKQVMATGNTVKSGTVQPATGTKRSWSQIKADLKRPRAN